MATITFYSSYKDDALEGNIDLASDTIRVMLTTSSYTPSTSHDFVDDITNEITGTGYTAKGEAISGGSVSGGTWDADNTSWTSATFTTRYGVIYKDTGTASTSPLIAYIDFGSDQSPSDQSFNINWNASGIINVA